MKKNFLVMATGLVGALWSTSLTANPINITIPDGVTYLGFASGNGAAGPWQGKPGLGAGGEDNETEPGTYTGDEWDLEALVYHPSSSMLSLIGTFDFQNGQTFEGKNYHTGAIFVRPSASATWSYAYVLTFGANGGTYTLFDSFSVLNPTDIPGSAPWTVDTTKPSHILGTGTFSYTTDIIDPFGLGLQRASGTGHNEIDLPLGALPGNTLTDFYVHNTIECGNDDIEGHYVPDGGITLAMLGFAVVALGLFRNRVQRAIPLRIRIHSSQRRRSQALNGVSKFRCGKADICLAFRDE